MWNDFIGAVRKSMAAFEAADMQWVYKLEPGFHDCVQACRRLENELLREDTSNIEPSINPGPNSNARLCFYTTSLTLPFTSRNAAEQLTLCLPLNLFLALHARKWCSFYVPDLWLMLNVCAIFLFQHVEVVVQNCQFIYKVVTFADDEHLHDWFWQLRWVSLLKLKLL